MVEIIRPPRRPSFGEIFGTGFGQGTGAGFLQGLGKAEDRARITKENAALEKAGFGDLVGFSPEDRKAAIVERLRSAGKQQLSPLQQSQQRLAEEKLKALQGQEALFSKLTGGSTQAPSFGGEQDIAGDQENFAHQIPAEHLTQLAGFAGQPGQVGIIGNIAKGELDRRKAEKKHSFEEEKFKFTKSEAERKSEEKKLEALRQEVAPIKKEISERAEIARRGIQNKEKLIEGINTGKLNDPSYAALLEAVPGNLGKRFLSKETVAYKSDLVQNYSDLKTIFSGATRVKELEILEGKIPDIYLTDTQKKQIILSQMETQRADILREEAAAEIEEEGKSLSAIQFRREVEKRVTPKLNYLFNRILDQHKAIIRDSENKKNIPLNLDDPEDREIVDQILLEAEGDWKKAERIAKQKGYKF